MMPRAIAVLLLSVLTGFTAAGIPRGAVAAESGVMGALAPQIESRLPQWVAAWKAASPGFDLRRFRLTLLKSVAESWSESYDPGEMHEELRRKLYVISPDGTKAIYPYATVSFFTRDGRTRVGIGTDGAVMLIDLVGRRTMWLGQCDLACGFHEAVWLGNDRLVVAGYEIDFDDVNCPSNRSCRSIPEVLLYDFSHRTMMFFKGSGIPAGPRQEYAVSRIREKLPQASD